MLGIHLHVAMLELHHINKLIQTDWFHFANEKNSQMGLNNIHTLNRSGSLLPMNILSAWKISDLVKSIKYVYHNMTAKNHVTGLQRWTVMQTMPYTVDQAKLHGST